MAFQIKREVVQTRNKTSHGNGIYEGGTTEIQGLGYRIQNNKPHIV